jgi:hypothetical protein
MTADERQRIVRATDVQPESALFHAEKTANPIAANVLATKGE